MDSKLVAFFIIRRRCNSPLDEVHLHTIEGVDCNGSISEITSSLIGSRNKVIIDELSSFFRFGRGICNLWSELESSSIGAVSPPATIGNALNCAFSALYIHRKGLNFVRYELCAESIRSENGDSSINVDRSNRSIRVSVHVGESSGDFEGSVFISNSRSLLIDEERATLVESL